MDVQREDIQELLEFFSKNTYNAWDTHPKVHQVMQRCLDLFGLDYTYSVVSNSSGELSSNYPSSLIFLESDKNHEDGEIAAVSLKPANLNGSANGMTNTTTNGDVPTQSSVLNGSNSSDLNGDSQTKSSSSCANISNTSQTTDDGFNPIQELPKIKDLCSKARYARCRARFPVPVILYKKKHICRSATLSGGPEIYGRTSFDYFFSGSTSASASTTTTTTTTSSANGVDSKATESGSTEDDVVVPESETGTQGDWQLFDRVRHQDIRLLKSFQVQTIVDLMVEKKKVKFGVYVTSSEKVDKKNRYSEFNLISLPYPGCEFFKQYRDNGYNGEELMFEWNQGYVDANIYVPSDLTSDSLNLEWSQYRKWDLVLLTQNYVKLLLAYLRSESSGLLIHCISGWDRTPLFLSLLRLSLWADGVIHKSLNAEQILYLTLSYDWLLFGHNLEDRLNKGEEILFFCFYFLTHIVSDEFSIDYVDEAAPLKQPKSDLDVTPNGIGDRSLYKQSQKEGQVSQEDDAHNWKECNGKTNGAQCGGSIVGKSSEPEEEEGIQKERLSNEIRTNQSNSHNHDSGNVIHESNPDCISTSNGSNNIPTIFNSNFNGHSNSNQNGAIASLKESTATKFPVPSVVNEMSGNGVEECLEQSSPIVFNSSSNFNSNSNVEEAEEACSVTLPPMVPNSSIPSLDLSENKINGDTGKSTRSTFEVQAEDGEEEGTVPVFTNSKSSLAHVHTLSASQAETGDSTQTTPIMQTSKSTTTVETQAITVEKVADRESERLTEAPASPINPPSQSEPIKPKLTTSPTSKPNGKGLNKDCRGSSRCEKLQLVRALFYSTYAHLLTNHHGVNENSSGGGSGLSVIIDNIATKVGIRAPNRSTS